MSGIYVLLGILLTLIILHPLIPELAPEKDQDMEEFRREAESFMTEMERLDSMEKNTREKRFTSKSDDHEFDSYRANPFKFNPNTATEEDLLKTGLDGFVARNIVSYRKKGGKFKKPEDLEKIYGMQEDWIQMVRPYVVTGIEEDITGNRLHYEELDEENIREKPVTSSETTPPVFIELNSADSADLVQCTGIGPSFAKRIISYRELLGGYYDKKQLLEVSGMDTARYSQFVGQVWADTSLVRKMDINMVTFKEMMRHPYFEYYLVKAIFNYKDKKNRVDSIGELQSLPEIYPELYQKISPYFDVRSP